jgi:hypothetical protein
MLRYDTQCVHYLFHLKRGKEGGILHSKQFSASVFMNSMDTTRNVSAILAKTLRLRINNGNRTVFRQLRRVRSAGSLMSNKRNVAAANLSHRPKRAKTLQLRINNGSSTNSRQLRRMMSARSLNIQNQRSVEINNDHVGPSFDRSKATQKGEGTTQNKSVRFQSQQPVRKTTKNRVNASPWSEFQVMTELWEAFADVLATYFCACLYDEYGSTDCGSDYSFSLGGNTYDATV